MSDFIIFRTKIWLFVRKSNVFDELLEGKTVENKKTKFSHAKQIFLTFFRNTNEYEY